MDKLKRGVEKAKRTLSSQMSTCIDIKSNAAIKEDLMKNG